MERLWIAELDTWHPHDSSSLARDIMGALESGKVVYLPKLNFAVTENERSLFNGEVVPVGMKNISYDAKKRHLSGVTSPDLAARILPMMQRYQQQSTQLLRVLCPQYQPIDACGRTSFRPVEIKGRKAASYRKDDTRLHVDAFPSTPVNNKRILRVFTNINPYGESRLWRLGEPFADVIQQFLPRVRRMLPGETEILYHLKITRRKRLLYDHCMLQIHNKMKKDLRYQQTVTAAAQEFPPGSTWLVYTDLVSHAALAGRFVLEQTYYPTVDNMLDPSLAPQRQIQKILEQNP